ncbi:DHHA1 domain-containing protein, partial [Roseburia faecis]|nr:DHHA1 domain-containing protein [Roseburia faecis]
GISARSMGNINVQIIMEKMGGGGHLANAATQIAGKTVSEVKAELIRLLTTGDQSEDETEKEY